MSYFHILISGTPQWKNIWFHWELVTDFLGWHSSSRAGNADFQHDGVMVPAHYFRRVREILDECFPDRWIGRDGPIVWPARSLDLNVLDYFVWGYVKAAVEHKRWWNDTQNEVRDEIIAAFQIITSDSLCNAVNFLKGRTLLASAKKAFRAVVTLEV